MGSMTLRRFLCLLAAFPLIIKCRLTGKPIEVWEGCGYTMKPFRFRTDKGDAMGAIVAPYLWKNDSGITRGNPKVMTERTGRLRENPEWFTAPYEYIGGYITPRQPRSVKEQIQLSKLS